MISDGLPYCMQVLFDLFPTPFGIDEVSTMPVSKLSELLELPYVAAAQLRHHACHSTTLNEFLLACAGHAPTYEEIKPVLPRFGDEKLCTARMHEAFRVVDELLGPNPNGEPAELWQMARRELSKQVGALIAN